MSATYQTRNKSFWKQDQLFCCSFAVIWHLKIDGVCTENLFEYVAIN